MTTYDELFSMNSDVKIHQRHLYFLVTEVFKLVNNVNVGLFQDDFCII